MLKSLLLGDCSRSLLLLKLSRLSRKYSIDSSSLFFSFFYSCQSLMTFHTRSKSIHQYLEDLVCSVTLLLLHSCSPSRMLSVAVQACLSSFKLSCSRCSLITSTQVSMQPSESSLNSLGFLKVFRDSPPLLSLESVFLVANASSVLFIISHVLPYVMASGSTTACNPESSDFLVEFESPSFIRAIVSPDAIVLSIRANGVGSRFLRCGST